MMKLLRRGDYYVGLGADSGGGRLSVERAGGRSSRCRGGRHSPRTCRHHSCLVPEAERQRGGHLTLVSIEEVHAGRERTSDRAVVGQRARGGCTWRRWRRRLFVVVVVGLADRQCRRRGRRHCLLLLLLYARGRVEGGQR